MQTINNSMVGYHRRKDIFIDIRLYLIYCSMNFSTFDKDIYYLKKNIDKLILCNSYKRLLKIYDKLLNYQILSLKGV